MCVCVACRLLFIVFVWCSWFVVVACCLSVFVVRCLLCVACCLLCVVGKVLIVVCCVLFDGCYLFLLVFRVHVLCVVC